MVEVQQQTSLILALDHVQLAMPHGGEAQARSFYVDVLGMEEVPKPAHLAVGGGCWFAAGTVQIHLGLEDGFTPSRRAHVGLLVSDLPTLVTRLEQGGVPFQPGKPLDGYRRGDVLDPFGNRIELLQKL